MSALRMEINVRIHSEFDHVDVPSALGSCFVNDKDRREYTGRRLGPERRRAVRGKQ